MKRPRRRGQPHQGTRGGLLRHIGPDTIAKLMRAAEARMAEADSLVEAGYFLAAIYLYGYAAEIILGVAYFRMEGYSRKDPISDDRRIRVTKSARQLSEAEDRSHPVDGWARLLVQDRRDRVGRPYEPAVERTVLDLAKRLCENWGPKLRYRALKPERPVVEAVQEAAHWFLKNQSKL